MAIGPSGARRYRLYRPAGIRAGQSIRLARQGERGGDLMIEIDYQEHPEFELDGQNVLYTVTLMPWQAALGAAVSVPTLGGKVGLKVPQINCSKVDFPLPFFPLNLQRSPDWIFQLSRSRISVLP